MVSKYFRALRAMKAKTQGPKASKQWNIKVKKPRSENPNNGAELRHFQLSTPLQNKALCIRSVKHKRRNHHLELPLLSSNLKTLGLIQKLSCVKCSTCIWPLHLNLETLLWSLGLRALGLYAFGVEPLCGSGTVKPLRGISVEPGNIPGTWKILSVESWCGTLRSLNLYLEPLRNLELFACGTLVLATWNRCPAVAPNHPKALLARPQAFQAVEQYKIRGFETQTHKQTNKDKTKPNQTKPKPKKQNETKKQLQKRKSNFWIPGAHSKAFGSCSFTSSCGTRFRKLPVSGTSNTSTSSKERGPNKTTILQKKVETKTPQAHIDTRTTITNITKTD